MGVFGAFDQSQYFFHAFFQDGVCAEYARMRLDGALQFAAQRIDVFATGLIVQAVKALFGEFARILRQGFQVGFGDVFNHTVAGRFTEYH